MHPTVSNIGAYITAELALDSTSVGAGLGGSGTAVNGNAYDRFLYNPQHLSGKLMLGVKATLASGNTLAVAVEWQDSANGSSWATYGTNLGQTYPGTNASGTQTITANNAGGVKRDVLEFPVNLLGARRHVRAVVRPTLSASGVDTAVVCGVLVLGGGETRPEDVHTDAPQ